MLNLYKTQHFAFDYYFIKIFNLNNQFDGVDPRPSLTSVSSQIREELAILCQDNGVETNTSQIMLGKLLDGRYRIAQILGAGGFGETYIAEDTRRIGNPRCVVKRLRPASNDSNYLEIARRLFYSEAETLEKLGDHDQIPRPLAYFEEEEEFYLVQDFIDGNPLSRELLPGQRWDESQVIELLVDVLGILDFVHSYGVIHRDIKPDNLIRRRKDRRLVLIDFGAVKQVRLNQSQMTDTVAAGTPGYMPAEQGYGKPRLNSDLYALGMTGIQALTGLLPTELKEDRNGEIIWQNYAQVSDRLAAILSQMVRYDYRNRYQSADEVLQALELLSHPIQETKISYKSPTKDLPNSNIKFWATVGLIPFILVPTVILVKLIFGI